jgi:hypothetical protein
VRSRAWAHDAFPSALVARYGAGMRSLLALLFAVGISACGGGSGASGVGEPGATPTADGPRLVRFEYRVRDHQLTILGRDNVGQVIGLAIEGPITLIADAACGFHGRRNGQASRFTLPARRLHSGRHRFTVRLTASTCRRRPKLRESTSQVILSVAPDGSTTARDSRGTVLWG